MSLTDMSAPQGLCYSAKGVMFYCAVAFLAGLSNNAFVKKLNDLAKALFMNTIDTEKGLVAERTDLENKKNDLEAKRKEIEEAEKKLQEREDES